MRIFKMEKLKNAYETYRNRHVRCFCTPLISGRMLPVSTYGRMPCITATTYGTTFR